VTPKFWAGQSVSYYQSLPGAVLHGFNNNGEAKNAYAQCYHIL